MSSAAASEPLKRPGLVHRLPRFVRTPAGFIGLSILALVVAIALGGPVLAPHASDEPVGIPGSGPAADAPLGTDNLGRDVLSRTLSGGLSVLLLGSASIAIAYFLGLTTGLIAGFNRTWIDPVLMRGVDVLLSFPPLLLLLVLVAGAGRSPTVLIIGVALVLAPGVARIVRTATLEVSVKGYVEAAIARGERSTAIITREILPNIIQVILADFGIRFGAAIVLVASLNFLGVGLRPPTADWGLMITENRDILSSNSLALVAPATMLVLLTISVNLVADAYARSLGRSSDDS